MHTEINPLLNSMPQQQNQHQHPYVSYTSQDHPPENQQQHVFTHLPTITTTTTQQSTLPVATVSLNEGFYTEPHLMSEFPSQYNSTSKLNCNASFISSSPSSSSSSSSESNFPCSNFSSDTCKNNTAASIGVNLRVTGQCSQGGRKYMEDYFSVAYQQSENAKDLEYAFIGIYDGHGGAEAAKFAKEHLMMEIINQRLFWSDYDHDVLRAIREGYIATHYAMWREQDKWPKTANGLPSTAGTTATVAFIRREKIYIGHVGDSGIVLGIQNENENFWRAKQLTTDHKPESVEERTRIMNSGGKVVVKSGVPRVVWNRPRNASHRGPIRKKTLTDEIPFLAVARSLGDLWSYNSERNEFVVSPDPDVRVIPINPNTFRCLIFGTDGLWNVVSAQEAVNTVREKELINERLQAQGGENVNEGNQWTNPSKSLVEQALRTWSIKKMRADNTSVVTVILYPPGQSNYNTQVTYKDTGTFSNPPAFVQPLSYGLEYTQVQAEIPVYDDSTTYKEMALKYLPPVAYRNFNYYADESDTDGSEEEEDEELLMTTKTSKKIQQNTNYQQHLPSNSWNLQNSNSNTNGTIQAEEDHGEESDCEEDNEDDNENEDDNREGNVANERQVCVLNYQNYVHMEAEETNNATDSYINTFAESYNSILKASQDNCIAQTACCASTSSSCSNSNSNSNCQSVTPPNIHTLLEEQQLYQQQCMSEEEGYSLTKLETRREQQTCKTQNISNISTGEMSGVQTFKIFNEPQSHSSENIHEMDNYHTNTEQFYNQHQQFLPQLQQKPLELHSLLQQEREEEQQVAYERLQMENKLAAAQLQHQNIAAYACLQTIRHEETIPSTVQESNILVEQQHAVEEYLEEEEIITAETSYDMEQDESVQINEISSSSCGEESLHKLSNDVEIQYETRACRSETIEKIEKIEILQNIIFESPKEESDVDTIIRKENCSSSNISKSSICFSTVKQKTTPSTFALAPLKSCLTQNKHRKSHLYSNVPNENLQRISNSKKNFSKAVSMGRAGAVGRSLCRTQSGGNKTSSLHNMTPPAASSTPIIQRQLRSTTNPCTPSTPTMDYGKRTLRTRNPLSKDLKAKNVLVQAALKYPHHNTITRNFLRTTASNLLVGKPMLISEQHLTPCNRRSLSSVKNVHSANRSSIKTRREKEKAINGSFSQCKGNIQNSPHHLNLRSRQAPSTTSPTAKVSALRSPPAASSPVIKRASLTDRRILRSMHTRTTSSKGSQTPANFSKSTRSQSTGSNLAAPPPSPKIINAAAAVAAATRARSLLSSKHAATTSGTQSVVSAVFSKRTSLRSNGTTHPAALSPIGPSQSTSISSVTSSSTRQTLRGRIVKKLKR